jgi:predicted dehydrogenase
LRRFNPRLAYAKKKLSDGTLGKPVSVMVSRHLSREPRQEDRQPRPAVAGGDGIHT